MNPTMTAIELQPLLPLLVLTLGAALLMVQIAFIRSIRLTAAFTLVIFLSAALACLPALEASPQFVTPLLLADPVALTFSALFCLSGALITLLSIDYISHCGDQPEEYFLLLLLSSLGACVLAYAVHLASLLLGMELLSVALYALIAYTDKTAQPLEAASKYLVLSAAASATILFGFALLYALTGTLAFTELGQQLTTLTDQQLTLTVAAVLIMAGMGFKLSLVPFHMWTPDVYQGAPAPVAGYLASTAKAAVFLVLLRWFLQAGLFRFTALLEAIALMAMLSMLVGNLLALQQNNIKRMLAYSSIAHMGYLLTILVVCGASSYRPLAVEAAFFYLIAYTVTTLAAFTLVTIICGQQGEKEPLNINAISGLFWRQPLLAGLMLVALLSLAGIPLTAGFIGKLYIFSAVIRGEHWWLLASLVIGSGIGLYYYLRLVFAMTARIDLSSLSSAGRDGDRGSCTELAIGHSQRLYNRAIAAILIASILLLGTVPQSVMMFLQTLLKVFLN